MKGPNKMKALEIKHGMAIEQTRVIGIRGDAKKEYIPKGYSSLTRLERLIATNQHDICLANYVIIITIFPNKM